MDNEHAVEFNEGPKTPYSDFQEIDREGDIFRQMFKYSVIPTIIHDMEMNIINVNDAALSQFGFTLEEIYQKSVFDLHPPAELETSKTVLNEMESKDKLSVQALFVRKDGSVFTGEATPCKFMLGNTPVIHVFIKDITERKRAEFQIRAKNRELLNKNKELEQFAFIAAHDLKTPLNSLISFTDLLKRKLDSIGLELEESKEINFFLERIQKNTLNMEELIKDVLSYARVEKQDLEAEPVELSDVLKEVIATYQKYLDLAQAKVRSEGLSQIIGVRSQIKQLLQNLIENSIKFKREGVPLEIDIIGRAKKNGLEVIYEDNGIGISPKASKKIFELFQRAEEAKDYPGTGLGLSICQKIVKLHGGSIEVSPKINEARGAKFIINLKNMESKKWR